MLCMLSRPRKNSKPKESPMKYTNIHIYYQIDCTATRSPEITLNPSINVTSRILNVNLCTGKAGKLGFFCPQGRDHLPGPPRWRNSRTPHRLYATCKSPTHVCHKGYTLHVNNQCATQALSHVAT